MAGTKENLMNQIIEEEWKQFQRVNNQGGRADCQDRPYTFYDMRRSQFIVWPEELLESYYRDLREAGERGDNLIELKYAYMMRRTASDEYKKIEKYLPRITEDQQKQIDEIADIHTNWTIEFDKKYPYLAGRSRTETEDIGELGMTSFRTYLTGELATYSRETLGLFFDFTKECQRMGINLTREIRKNIVKNAGYHTLEEAEEALGRRYGKE